MQRAMAAEAESSREARAKVRYFNISCAREMRYNETFRYIERSHSRDQTIVHAFTSCKVLNGLKYRPRTQGYSTRTEHLADNLDKIDIWLNVYLLYS